MSILNIREAKRAGSRVVLGIAGPSGSGKTYTALKIAEGMVDDPRKIGLLDTENKRGSLYADILNGPFLIGDLYPPFSPLRYAEAIKEFQAAGIEVLVVDSVTHEWEGEGGCEDIANAPLLAGKRMADWKRAKSEHKKFMNALLQCDMHVICCIRAREKTSFTDPKKPVSLGLQPIAEKNFMFEMTASFMMWNEGSNQQFLKIPEALRPIFGTGEGYIGPEAGQALINWVNSGDQTDIDLEQYKSQMQMAASGGVAGLQDAWKQMPKNVIKRMKQFYPQFENSAKEYDNQAQPEQEAQDFESTGGFNPQTASKPEPVKQEQSEGPPVQADTDEVFEGK